MVEKTGVTRRTKLRIVMMEGRRERENGRSHDSCCSSKRQVGFSMTLPYSFPHTLGARSDCRCGSFISEETSRASTRENDSALARTAALDDGVWDGGGGGGRKKEDGRKCTERKR